MLFGYIKDYTVKYVYRDQNTNKIVKSFDSYEQCNKWLSNYSQSQIIEMLKGLKAERLKVFWYENNFELLKFIFPFLILFHFIGFFAFLLFGLFFWIYYFYYQKRFKEKK